MLSNRYCRDAQTAEEYLLRCLFQAEDERDEAVAYCEKVRAAEEERTCRIVFTDTSHWTDVGREYDCEFTCSACGCDLTDDWGDAIDSWMHNNGDKPFNYCLSCGARIVKGDKNGMDTSK